MMTFLIFAITPFVLLYIIYKVIRFFIGMVCAIREDDPYHDEPRGSQRKPLTRIFNVQCPHCGVTISITGNTKEATCDHCHRDFLVDWSAGEEDEDDKDDNGYNTAGLAAYYYYGSK